MDKSFDDSIAWLGFIFKCVFQHENFEIYSAQITGECIYEIFEIVLSLNCKTIWLKTFDLVINFWLISYKVPNLYSAIRPEMNNFKYKYSTTVKCKG